MSRRLYTTRVTRDALQTQEPASTAQLEALLGLSSTGTVTDVGQQPDDLRLDGQYRGKYAEMLSVELRELLSSPTLDAFEWYQISGNAADAGYYAVRSITGGRLQPQAGGVTEFDARLVQEGTRASHRRAVGVDPKERPHPFGNDTAGYVGVPASASKVLWLDRDRTQQQPATPDQTMSAEFGDVDLFDAETAPYTNRPYLVYDLDYPDAGDVDTAVFDTYGRSETDAEGIFAWQQVHRTDHEFRGEVVIQNGRVELTLDEANTTLTAERWDETTDTWSDVSLPASDWQLFDVDLTHPGAAQVRTRLTFQNTTDNSLFELEAALHRGWDDVLVYSPEDLQLPSGLQDLLAPIAASTVIDPQPERTLIPRSDLR